MEITKELITELQNRLKTGNRRGVHLNAITGRSRKKFDITRLSALNENLPQEFVNTLLSEDSFSFKVSWKNNVKDFNELSEDEQIKLTRVTQSFENLINDTNAIESEKGINTFGFGFPICVRRDKSDNKLTVAPLIIWSLQIKKTKEMYTWEILRNKEDPFYINEVFLNHLQSDSEIEIEQIPNEIIEKGILDKTELLEICLKITKKLNSTVSENVKTSFSQKVNNIKPIEEKKQYEKLSLSSTTSLIEFAGLFSVFEVNKHNIIDDYSELYESDGLSIETDELKDHFFQSISSVETDPSQQGILHSLVSSRNVLIQGPPGTGKSQTLTAVLVNALENKKKVLVVCEKRTALEVLENSLHKKDLGELTVLIRDIVKDRRVVVDSVRARIDENTVNKMSVIHSTLNKSVSNSNKLINQINSGHQKIGKHIFETKNWTDIVGKYLKEIRINENKELNLDKKTFLYESNEYNHLSQMIEDGQQKYQEYNSQKTKLLIKPYKFSGSNPYGLEEDIRNDFKFYQNQVNQITKLINEFKNDYVSKRKQQINTQRNQINEQSASLFNLLKKYNPSSDFFNENKTQGFLFKLLAIFLKVKKTILLDQQVAHEQYDSFRNLTIKSEDFEEIHETESIRDKKILLEQYDKTISKLEEQQEIKINNEFNELDLIHFNDPTFKTSSLNTLQQTYSKLIEKIKTDDWSEFSLGTGTLNQSITVIQSYIDSNEQSLNENDSFITEYNWYSFFNGLSDNEANIINELTDTDDWKSTFTQFYFNSLLLKSADNNLPTDDNNIQKLSKALENLKTDQISFIKLYWKSRQIGLTEEFDRHNSLNVTNLYNKRKTNKYKRLSLREIIKFDKDLFTSFFPVVLTTPEVASNLFRGEIKYFDIVMFDEASQLKLEENLPAILKGKQVIVAGDEHQMPPSSYFSKKVETGDFDEDEYEDEDERIKMKIGSIALDCESLLEFASDLGFNKRFLDFHYRSRHPYLIDFSNFAFYNKRLQPLPNEYNYTPIKYVQVNGTYDKNTNDAEANSVLSIIENNITRLPDGSYPSIGVATFNIKQRDHILNKINERRQFEEFRNFNEKIIELEENGFFVKNLENIQGDERDVIILSTTYGISPQGKFTQRFGSINQAKGYKLLNVIVTRAKYKVYVCTSVPETVLLNYRDSLLQNGENNGRSVFYAYLAYAKAVSEQDNDAREAVLNTLAENSTNKQSIDNSHADLESPFEEEVYEALTEHFDEKSIIPQLQYAGFRIDLVYDEKKVGVPPIAIECDGAKYHSSQEAYLYDRYRQNILESHGFVFHRIWSTNWWRSPKAETKKLVDFIKKTRKTTHKVNDKSYINQVFLDDIKQLAKPRATSNTNEFEKIKTIAPVEIEKNRNEVVETVKIGSVIKIMYLDNNKKIEVEIVDKEPDGKKNQITFSSPLGRALIGNLVGDIVEFSEDKSVEILDIQN